MKPVLKATLISLGSAVIGGAIVFAALKYKPFTKSDTPNSLSREEVYDDILSRQQGIQQKFDNLFDENFFNQNDPFEQMKQMREKMDKRMEELGSKHGFLSNPFDSWFSDKFGGGTINDIARREDNDFVYYDIQVPDVKATSITTKIENGYITITGSLEKRSNSSESEQSTQSIFKSAFNRTFPLPEHVDQKRYQMVPEKDKIVLKFPKLKT